MNASPLSPRRKKCGHCGREIMSRPSIHTGKGMARHKCPHGRWCDRGHKFLCGNNTPGCRLCQLERRAEDFEERGLTADAEEMRRLVAAEWQKHFQANYR